MIRIFVVAMLALACWPSVASGASYEIRCARIHRLATATKPADNVKEEGTCDGRYHRGQEVHVNMWKVDWLLHDGTSGPVPPAKFPPDLLALKVRPLVDGTPVGPWGAGPGTTDLTTALPTLTDGSHALSLEIDWPGNSVLVSSVTFTKGPPQGPGVSQMLSVGPIGFDYAYSSLRSSRTALVPWPGRKPDLDIASWDRKVTARPYAVFPGSDTTGGTMLVRVLEAFRIMAVGPVGINQLPREPMVHSANSDGKGDWTTGRMGTVREQQYYYTGMVSAGSTSTHTVPLVDGPRGVGTMPYIVEAEFCKGGLYATSASGAIRWMQTRGPNTGRTLTVGGYRIKDDAVPGYWRESGSEHFESAYEFFGTWASGHVGRTTLNEPWSKTILDVESCRGGTGAHKFLIPDTKNDRLVFLDHIPAHEPGGKPVFKVIADFSSTPALCRWPWGSDLRPGTNWTYVTCMLSHTIVRTRPKIPGDFMGEWETELVMTAAKPVTREAIGVDVVCRGCGHDSTVPSTKIRELYHADGAFGVASQVFPQFAKFDSKGQLVVCSRYGFTCGAYDIDARAYRAFGSWKSYPEPGAAQWRDVMFDIAKHGGAGQLDMLRISGWAAGAAFGMSSTGQWLGLLWPDAPTRILHSGQMDGAIQIAYPAAIATNQDGEEIYFGTGDQHYGIMRWLKEPGFVPVNIGKYADGYNTWLNGGVSGSKYPAFALTHGQQCWGRFGLPTCDTFNRMTDVAMGEFLRAGAGTGIPRPEIIGTRADNLVYWMRMQSDLRPGGGGDPPPPPPPPPPSTFLLTVVHVGPGVVLGGGQFTAGALVTVSAFPGTGNRLAGWSPADCASPFQMPASNKTCTVTFEPVVVPPPLPPPPAKPRVIISCPPTVECTTVVP